jgi:hypothetical protein
MWRFRIDFDAIGGCGDVALSAVFLPPLPADLCFFFASSRAAFSASRSPSIVARLLFASVRRDESCDLSNEVRTEFSGCTGDTERNRERRILAFLQLPRTNIDLELIAVEFRHRISITRWASRAVARLALIGMLLL